MFGTNNTKELKGLIENINSKITDINTYLSREIMLLKWKVQNIENILKELSTGSILNKNKPEQKIEQKKEITYGEKVRIARKALKLSANKLSQKIGVSYNDIYRLEKNMNKRPTKKLLVSAINKELNIKE